MRVSEGPRYYASKGAWFANINKERVKLVEGPEKATKKEAKEKYEALSQVKRAEKSGDKAECWVILNAYLDNARTRTSPQPLSPNTYRKNAAAINSFVGMFGKVRVRDLKKQHFNDWIYHMRHTVQVNPVTKKRTTWGNTTCNMRLAVLATAFRWAVNEGELIGESPFERGGKTFRLPPQTDSGKKLAITRKEHDALLLRASSPNSNPCLPLLLNLLWHTGARPAEVYLIRAEEWDEKTQAIHIDPSHPLSVGRLKNRRHIAKKGRKRIIRIPSSLVAELKKQMKLVPEGPIFRTKVKKLPYNNSSITDRFGELINWANHYAWQKEDESLKVRKGISAYSYRHAFVTRWLTRGDDAWRLGELIDTTVTMLHRHYSHLFEEHNVLLQSVERAAKLDGESSSGQQSSSPASRDDQSPSERGEPQPEPNGQEPIAEVPAVGLSDE